MKVFAIIQARMGSERLPGKVVRELSGKPMIVQLIERLKTCKCLAGIVLATSDKAEDKLLLQIGRENNVFTFAGPEQDVLARFYLAAKQVGAEHIVRVTGDNPLTDPQCVDLLAERQLIEGMDYG